MEVSTRVTDRLLDGCHERGDVVALLGLELGDPLGIDARALQRAQRLDRNPAELGPSFACEQLDIQPALQS